MVSLKFNMKKNFHFIAKEVIETEILSLKKLKVSINKKFNKIIEAIIKCKNGKIIVSGVGKSGIISRKWAATFSSTGTPSFFLDASNASHGDLGQIDIYRDVLILISLSGQSEELKNIIQFASRNKKLKLIGITSNKNSLLYKNSDIKFLMPKIKEAGPGNLVPTSSTTLQLALGDAIAIACMKFRKFGNLDFKKFHPGGSLAIKLRTVEDLMRTGNSIPFVKENLLMKEALRVLVKKGLGVLIVKNNKGNTIGIVTDGDIKRANQKFKNIQNLRVKNIMTKNPLKVDKDVLADKALSLMSENKITSLCVYKNNKKPKTIGIIHIHDILKANIA